MPQTDIVALPFVELARLMAAGELTSEALVAECLARIEAQDAALHAFVAVYPEAAIATARRLDRERVEGRARGPLHGIPIAVKDLADTEGHVTGFGSRAYGTTPAIATAPFLRRLEDAGMVLIGKTQMVEFAFGSWGTNAALGAPRNPRMADDHYVAGGSSSGSAVAVAASMVPAAIGSDTGGSVRIPAALCGTIGLKTSRGVVSTDGVAPLSPSFDTIGPLTHHIDDARLIFAAMRDPSATVSAAMSDPNRSIGTVRTPPRAELDPLDPAVAAALLASIAGLSETGLSVQPLVLPRAFADYQAETGAIMAKEAYGALRHLVEDPDLPLDPAVRSRVRQGAAIDDAAHAARVAARHQALGALEEMLGKDEVILLPTTPFPACRLVDVEEAVFPMSRLTRLANYLDLCAISVPVATTATGLPIGMQICARHGREDLVMAVAAKLQAAMQQRNLVIED